VCELFSLEMPEPLSDAIAVFFRGYRLVDDIGQGSYEKTVKKNVI